jgi:hypothetical protein
LTVVLYCCEVFALTFRKECNLEFFSNKVLVEVLGHNERHREKGRLFTVSYNPYIMEIVLKEEKGY